MDGQRAAPEYGARIERGKVIRVNAEGYRICSDDRPGMETGALNALGDMTYDVGDRVCFFMFDDGAGMIIGPARG